jgi:GAF domain-containing protein
LIETLLVIAVENAGAQRGVLILLRGDEPQIEAEAITANNAVTVNFDQAVPTPAELPDSMLRYVIRTQERVILDDASVRNVFSEDEYVRQQRARSILCLPLVKQAKLMGVLYLENNLAPPGVHDQAACYFGTAVVSGGYLFGPRPIVCMLT